MLWDFLNRDVALIGDLYSPVLSWLGACGMVLFVAWQAMKLKKEAGTIHRAFNRIDPIVTALVKGRQNLEHDRFAAPTPKGLSTRANPATEPVRVDRDDLHKLDACMEHEPLFRGLWAQYRRTLIPEQVPWFMEPRIFGTKRAAEVFSQDALFSGHMNLGFYRHLPSLITGIGLLLTFLALLVGLGKLHAEGSEIVGIQGLINGLAGKFLTSIVGLGMAQLFLFMERPLIAGLTSAHQKFLEHIDQLFSRKTVESMLDELISLQRDRQNTAPAKSRTPRETAGSGEPDNLAQPAADLTAAIPALTQGQEEEHARTRKIVTELPHMIRDAVQHSLQGFTTSIQELSLVLESARREETSSLAKSSADLTAAIQALTQGQEEEHARTRKTVNQLPALIREVVQGTRGEDPAGLEKSAADLTAAVHALMQRQEEEHARTRKIVTELPLMIREAAQGSLQEFTSSIQELSQTLEGVGGNESFSQTLPATDFTTAVHALMQSQEEEHAQTRKTVTELSHMIREAVHASLEEFTISIQELSQGLRETGGGESDNPEKPTTELTAAIHALTQGQNEEHAQTRKIVTELPHMIREAVQGSLQEFTHSIQELSLVLKDVQSESTPVEKAIEDRPLLWKTAAYPRDTSKDNLLDKIAAWPRRQEPSKHRRTG